MGEKPNWYGVGKMTKTLAKRTLKQLARRMADIITVRWYNNEKNDYNERNN